MAHKNWCGKPCCDCKKPCELDETISCSPDCENLTPDGKIKIKACLEAGCENVKYLFDMARATDQKILDRYGEIAPFPY